ncbi:ras guanine nucleotide exchange factor domain-containing protein [Pisolithus marmoratus]|nr:ras guanine nucleotide exchange factor domain-containing protein [Pisolithus marmoratus]
MAVVGVAYGSLSSYHGGATTDEDPQAAQLPEEPMITTFFCRALYDYQTQDSSSLSFRKNDIIEVLTRLESGWWDGLLGDERGWFPSNYVTIISEEEAELALSAIESQQQVQPSVTGTNAAGDPYVSDAGWGGEAANMSSAFPEHGNTVSDGGVTSSDFWMPQVTVDGQIYYVNTQTGQHSRDLPLEVDETSEGDLVALAAAQPSSRTASRAGLGFTTLTESSLAGFGVPKRTGTPEPWVRKLADDGIAYYFQNKHTGEVSWSVPDGDAPGNKGRTRALTNSSTTAAFNETKAASRMRSDSATSQTRGRRDPYQLVSEHKTDSSTSGYSRSSGRDRSQDATTGRAQTIELTAAERIAQSLQETLAPPPPDLVSDLCYAARSAVASVLQKNQSLWRLPRQSEHGKMIDGLIMTVVAAVRNLLYISTSLPGHIPHHLIPPDARDRSEDTTSQALLKPAQRKVTATLSKLVLSARAMEYDSGPAAHEIASRIQSDAEELDRAIVIFVAEVQRCYSEHQHGDTGGKRVLGCFSTLYLGLGLVGAGCAGTWKGFGWVPMDDTEENPQRILGVDVFAEFKTYMASVQAQFGTFHSALKNKGSDSQQTVWAASKEVVSGLANLLLFVGNIHVARHVDIDGFYIQTVDAEQGLSYSQTVESARILTRTLEAVAQWLYDDASTLLLMTQRVRSATGRSLWQDKDAHYEMLDSIATSLKSNLQFLLQTLDALLELGHTQAEIAQGGYQGAIEWRMSRLSFMDSHFEVRPMSILNPADPESEDLVDIEIALGGSVGKVHNDRVPTFRSQSQLSDTTITLTDRTWRDSRGVYDPSVSAHMLVPSETHRDVTSINDPTLMLEDNSAVARATTTAQKIKKILGEDAPEHLTNTKPWYLQPDYTKEEMIIDVGGAVRAGTVAALVERLTSHETGDPNFIKTFLMTYKSFTTLDELFDLLVKRFYIQPPEGLIPSELEEWRRLKQHIIQTRVLNTVKTMITDDDFLEKEDMYILDRMKEFLLKLDDTSQKTIATHLLTLIERARTGGLKKTITPNLVSPPTSIMPKTNKKLKLLDVEPLELARQLTILESHLYQRIRPMECLQRAREQKTDHHDNIARVIQTSNRIANWVADNVLSNEDSRKRATVIKQFILIADRCRSLHNYSSMVAIVSGLNSPPIRRLKRSWEQVNSRHMTQLNNCEMTIDSGKNFNNYRSTLAKVAPPCVPFIGVFLTTLTFIQDGSKDTLPESLVNFRKRQKASEVIQDIQRWQTIPHHFHPLASVQGYLEESLNKFNDQVDVSDMFWNLSLEREPREREDERMARLLQESGFL